LASTAHGHGHSPALQHHFETPAQQKEAATLGMWAFLITEIMLFGGIFMAYIVYRWAFPEIWAAAATHLNTPLATLNTVVLLVSSLTVALAVNAAENGKTRKLVMLLVATMVLGVGFIVIKGYEYSEKFSHCAGYKDPISWVTGVGHDDHAHECLVPGRAFLYPEEHGTGHAANAPAAPTTAGSPTPYQLFYLLYFAATGLHAIHMFIGLGLVGTLTFMAVRGRFSPEYFTPVEIGGLYWHLIDIVWVFLFPLFYLV
jgi:cytochrome c oxidase subunit 3